MPKYVIEREMPGVGQLTDEELAVASQKSNTVIATMAPNVQWVHSYVTDDKIYCIYIADSADDIREHATKTGLPASSVHLVRNVIDPTTAEPT